MEQKEKASEEKQLTKTEEISLEETQLSEQLYNSAGLDPVVDAGLKDYDERLKLEDKLITKVIGPRGSDIKGYGEAVAKRVAFAVYALINKQYGGKVGDLRSYIMALQEERDRANVRYDELMGRVVGILGEEYKELRTDSKAFMEKLTTVLGEDIKESRIDHKAFAESLADIDGLRSQIKALEKERKESKERYESRIAEADSRIKELESEKTALTSEFGQLREDHNRLKTAVAALSEAVHSEEIGKKLGDELHAFLLKDSKVPKMVIDGVGKFIDFTKYLGMAAKKGAEEATKQAEETLRQSSSR